MKFFFDNNLAPKIAKGLNVFVSPEHQVFHLKDKFPANAGDSDWMNALGKEENWVIVAADIHIGKNPHEIAAWKEAGHTIFFLKPGWLRLSFWDQAYQFVKCFPEIINMAEQAKCGTSFLVSVNGKIDR